MQTTLAAYRQDSRIGISLVGFSKIEQIQGAILSLEITLPPENLAGVFLAGITNLLPCWRIQGNLIGVGK